MKLGGSGYLENERTLPFAVCRILCVLESSVFVVEVVIAVVVEVVVVLK